jgi:hypothetical protein
MELTQDALDQFLAMTPEQIAQAQAEKSARKIVENDGLIERTTLIEKKLIIEDGRQLLTEERPITHSYTIL